MEADILTVRTVPLIGMIAFFMGLSLVLLARDRINMSLGTLLSAGGLLTCFSLVGTVDRQSAVAQYFGCLSLMMVVLQCCYWVFLVRDE